MSQAITQQQIPALEWDSIDTVFLDMDGTLLDLNYDNQVWSHIVPAALAEAEAQQISFSSSAAAARSAHVQFARHHALLQL